MPSVIYYFTGTGNSLAVARMVADKLGDTEVVSIFALRGSGVIPPQYSKVGFAIPTCFSKPTRVVMEIGAALQFSPNQKVFIITTCGGGDGFTRIDFSRLLQPKVSSQIQTFNLPMPPNHIVGFSPFPKFVQAFYFRRSKKATAKIARRIQSGIPTKPPKEMDREKGRRMSVRFNGRLGIEDIDSTVAEYYATDACVRCGTCEKICKVGNIKVSREGVSFGDNCQQCMACIQWCPQAAIAHPNVPNGRKRYRHPDITLDDMLR